MAKPGLDENELKLPPAWKKHLLPLRGKRLGKPVVLDAAAAGAATDRSEWIDAQLRRVFERPGNEAYAAAGLAYLDGAPDPRGAAAVAALLHYQNLDRTSDQALRPALDAWVFDYGLPFAVCAAIERLSMRVESSNPRQFQLLGFDLPLLEPSMDCLHHELSEGGIATLRSLLAAASDEDYAAAAAAADDHRNGPERRAAAAVLMPGEEPWVREVCAEAGVRFQSVLWHIVSEPEHLELAGLGSITGYWITPEVAALLDGVGAASLPVLVESLAKRSANPENRQILYKAIAMLPSDEAVSFLLGRLDDPAVFEPAAAAAARFPERTLRSIARLTEDAVPEQRAAFAGILAKIDPEVRERLDPTDRAAVERVRNGSGTVPAAAPEELPRLLSNPPWAAEKTEALIPGLTPPPIERVALTRAELEALGPLEAEHQNPLWSGRSVRTDGSADLDLLADAAMEVARPHFDEWNGDCWCPTAPVLDRILMRFGTAAIAPVLKAVKSNPNTAQAALTSVVSLEAARIAADWLVRVKTARDAAADWFARHPADAAALLIPDALGSAKKRRRAAQTALDHLAGTQQRNPCPGAAASYGSEVVTALDARSAHDPLTPIGHSIPKPGTWVEPAMLPQVLLRGGERALPVEAVRHLVTVLALATPEYRYSGIGIVAETCERESLSGFCLALFQRWLSVGAPPDDGWALTQLVHFADDETVRVLARLIPQWPGDGQHVRALTGLEVLGGIGSDAALRAVQGIAEKSKFQALREAAEQRIQGVASRMGLTARQLEDRLVPDFGLGEGPLLLDYGSRTFTVEFDEQLQPYITDADGKPRKTLPKPGVNDDLVLAGASRKRFTALKKDLRAVAADQVSRLETAMVEGDQWSIEDFRRACVEHPLTRGLAQRLVWIANDRHTFRIAEDGTFSDFDDECIVIPSTARVGVAHPLHLGAAGTERWARLLADYEILQPFEQLARPVMFLTEEELATGRLTRFEGAQVRLGQLLGLLRRGWQRTAVDDGHVEPGICFPLPGGDHLTVALHPGLWAGMSGVDQEQTLRGVAVMDTESYLNLGDPDPGPVTVTDPLAVSEALLALAWLTGSV